MPRQIHTSPTVESLSFTRDSLASFCQKLIVFLLSLLVFTVPLFFTWVNEELFEFNKMILTYGFTGIIVGVWVIRLICQGKFVWKKTPFDIPIGLFLLSQMISTFLSIHPRTSFFGYYTRFHGGLLSTFCYIALFYAVVYNFERKHLRSFFISLFSSALLVSLMAIPEHFGHSFSCLLINSNQQLSKGTPGVFSLSNMATNYNVTCWIQDVQNRVFASFGQPNWLAAYAITLLPLGVVLTLSRKKFEQIFYGITTLALFVTVLFTKSRSGFLGLAIGGFVFTAGAAYLWWRDHRKVNVRTSNFFAAAALALILLFTTLWFGTPYTPSLNSFRQPQSSAVAETTPTANRLDVGGTNSGEIRQIVWKGAIAVWRRYPFFGSGVETFAYSYYKDRPMEHNLVSEWDFLYNKAHNEFLNFLATTGIFGLGAYLAILGAFIGLPVWEAVNVKRKSVVEKKQHLMLMALSSGLIALSVSNFFGFSTVMVAILLFLFPALFMVLREEEETPAKFPQNFSTNQLVGIGLTLLAICIWVFWIWTMWEADHIFTLGKAYNQVGQVSEAVNTLQKAIDLAPNEDVFAEELSLAYARLGVAVADQTKDATLAAQVGQRAALLADTIVKNNPVNLNFYKTKTRVDITLAQFQPHYLLEARDTLLKARELAPTDPKILFNLAIIEISLKMNDEGLQHLEQVTQMKPDYEAARMTLGDEYMRRGQNTEAKKQFEFVLEHIQPNNGEAKQQLEVINSSASAKKK